jgi:transcriptional regulator with GAF, ATPase, and Fis domain
MAAAATTAFIRSSSRVLVASADSSFRKRLMSSPICLRALSEEAVGGAHALAKLAHFSCHSVLLDRNLPDLDSSEVAEIIRQRYPRIEVEFVDSRTDCIFPRESRTEAAEVAGENGTATTALKEVRRDVPASSSHVRLFTEEIAATLPGMLGSSRAMLQVYRLARMVAPRDTTVLITGETGTGKELVARAIHKLSPRENHPFVVINCAAIPEALFESELFGYSRGAFTGAVQSRLGRVHLAQGGTLFLDEIGELPLSLQAKLLRFLQDGEVQRLGSSEVYRVDVRVVCATNIRLLDHVQSKQFRQDLYYRLAIFPLVVPPLRERAEDISLLCEHFLAQLSAANSVPCKYLAPAASALLQRANWQGNVRELQHALERAFILAGNENLLRVEHFQQHSEAIQLREI